MKKKVIFCSIPMNKTSGIADDFLLSLETVIGFSKKMQEQLGDEFTVILSPFEDMFILDEDNLEKIPKIVNITYDELKKLIE